ncbi:hypothetical protein HDU93_005793 [Gonapodya sp. JEL0774]|nr:hypothetical protein HDU93_005793 [Gonapodya sp. JEL0774]
MSVPQRDKEYIDQATAKLASLEASKVLNKQPPNAENVLPSHAKAATSIAQPSQTQSSLVRASSETRLEAPVAVLKPDASKPSRAATNISSSDARSAIPTPAVSEVRKPTPAEAQKADPKLPPIPPTAIESRPSNPQTIPLQKQDRQDVPQEKLASRSDSSRSLIDNVGVPVSQPHVPGTKVGLRENQSISNVRPPEGQLRSTAPQGSALPPLPGNTLETVLRPAFETATTGESAAFLEAARSVQAGLSKLEAARPGFAKRFVEEIVQRCK